MQRQKALSLLLLPLLMTNSCILKRTSVRPLPNGSARTELEVKLSEIAWNHARCYFPGERAFMGDVEKQIARCKQELLQDLDEIPFQPRSTERQGAGEQTKALRDYFKDSYPTAGDALAALRTCCCCQGSAPHFPEYKNMAYFREPYAPQETLTTETQLMFRWLISWVSQRLTYKPDSRRLLLDLAIRTHDKDKAVVTILFMDNTFAGSVTTQDSLTISRGKYRYTIGREGYKNFDSATSTPPQQLNLMDWDWSPKGLDCTLVPLRSKLNALPCNLQKD